MILQSYHKSTSPFSFSCKCSRPYPLSSKATPDQIKCNRMYQYFTTLEMIKQHFYDIHKTTYSKTKDKMIMPEDIRSAKCNHCGLLLFCRGKYQIQKHVWLEHKD